MKQSGLHGVRIDEETQLAEEYRRMAADAQHEREAEEWCEGLIGDVANMDFTP